MKRTWLARRTPLRRKSWMKRSTRRNSYARRKRDLVFMAWVRKQPCIVRWPEIWDDAADPALTAAMLAKWTCFGEVQADHLGDRAMGRKADDTTCASLCRTHHDQRTNGWGLFYGWTRDRKRAFRQKAMALMRSSAIAAGMLAL